MSEMETELSRMAKLAYVRMTKDAATDLRKTIADGVWCGSHADASTLNELEQLRDRLNEILYDSERKA